MSKVKLKTKRGAARRFKKTGKGALKCRHANRNHILTKKATKRKRSLRDTPRVHPSDQKAIDVMLRA